MRLHDEQGRALETGAEVGRGGEGVVYALVGHDNWLAKVYNHPPGSERSEKLRAMVQLQAATPELSDWCAWPQAVLHGADGHVCGFAMPRVVDARPVHDVYSPEQRKQSFPGSGWDFLVRVATNCAKTFETLHQFGVIIGDVNERNLLVCRDGTVRLVDCDSFQIRFEDRLFHTGVGVVDYTPPELQGADFRRIERTANHDRFGLAVLLFKLLFMGRHPYSGGASGELAAAIAGYHYDYEALCARMRHLVPLSAVTSELRQLFGESFAESGTADHARPSSALWAVTLADFEGELVSCAHEPLHKVRQDAGRCVWCDLEAQLHYAYFARPSEVAYTSDWDGQLDVLQALTAALHATDAPMAPDWYDEPDAVQRALPLLQQAVRAEPPPDVKSWYLRVLGGLTALAGAAVAGNDARLGCTLLVGGLSAWVAGGLWQRLKLGSWRIQAAQLLTKQEEIQRSADIWKGLAYRLRQDDRRMRGEFSEIANQYEGLSRWRQGELDRLQRDVIDQQARRPLAEISLESVVIPGISTDRKRALLIRGLTTAADVQREAVTGIPGFTPHHIDLLVKWRLDLERRLGALKRQPPSASQLAAVDQNCRHIRDDLALQMRAVLAELADQTRLADQQLHDCYLELSQTAQHASTLASARVQRATEN